MPHVVFLSPCILECRLDIVVEKGQTVRRHPNKRGALVHPLDPDQPIRRLPHVIARSVDDTAFLVDERSESIFHLNPLGSALWNLLAAPHSINGATEVVHAAFPEVAREQIASDIRSLFLDLLDKGLAELT